MVQGRIEHTGLEFLSTHPQDFAERVFGYVPFYPTAPKLVQFQP